VRGYLALVGGTYKNQIKNVIGFLRRYVDRVLKSEAIDEAIGRRSALAEH
jgi:hypothetical protein